MHSPGCEAKAPLVTVIDVSLALGGRALAPGSTLARTSLFEEVRLIAYGITL